MAVNELQPPHITDQPIIARMKRICIEPGKSFDLPLLRVTGSRCPTSAAFCWTDSRVMMADIDDPLFLQVKEAGPSVLEPYAGKSIYANHGQRLVNGLRLMQSVSDLFLGWTEAARAATSTSGKCMT